MPVIVLETRDFTSPLFIVRTLEVLSSCTVFSLVSSLESKDLNASSFSSFRIFCMFTWCFFFVVTLLIHLLNTIQFHSLIRISWKNLTVTVAVLGALMSFSSFVFFPWMVMDHREVSARPVAAAVVSGLTALAYASEFFVLRGQADEQKGYMGSTPGLLKIIQLWGGVQIIPLVVFVLQLSSGLQQWQLLVSCTSYGVCVLMSLVTLVVILGDFAGRCLLPFDRFLAGFSLIGVLLYMTATVICLTKILQLSGHENNKIHTELVIMEMVVSSITLLAYTVDLAFAIKLLCDRSHM
ncbi:myeloid-associated differentiation marker homolog [Nematolebias whitei]|uniref:myeloid-associated differentiation marker homolog n=1 Tax=Nematolebias whitei TaxID=451745 RepID=UPI001899E68E|nr:myeloid-associated differentiation marker homolog [Nematolebias whitei]